MNTAQAHGLVAELLRYPEPERRPDIRTLIEEVARLLPGCRDALEPLLDLANGEGETTLEETYCRAFDNDPGRALEVGWQIYGENYDRGGFLVHMRGLLRNHGIEESGELPDHLGLVLRLLPRLGEEEARKLVIGAALPAARKVLQSFPEDDPWRGPVVAAVRLLQEHLEPASAPRPEETADA